jgi:hypothetical protein
LPHPGKRWGLRQPPEYEKGTTIDFSASDDFDMFRDWFQIVGLLRRRHIAVIFVVFILINRLIVDEYLALKEVQTSPSRWLRLTKGFRAATCWRVGVSFSV